jgi:hypothetical protein
MLRRVLLVKLAFPHSQYKDYPERVMMFRIEKSWLQLEKTVS